MTNEQRTLEPCMWCSSEDVQINSENRTYWVTCTCGASSRYFTTYKLAVEYWNSVSRSYFYGLKTLETPAFEVEWEFNSDSLRKKSK